MDDALGILPVADHSVRIIPDICNCFSFYVSAPGNILVGIYTFGGSWFYCCLEENQQKRLTGIDFFVSKSD